MDLGEEEKELNVIPVEWPNRVAQPEPTPAVAVPEEEPVALPITK